jgi:hypothetical protein
MGAKGKHDKRCFYFGEESIYVGGAPYFKNICDGPFKWLLLKKEKRNLGHIPSLINRIMNEQIPPL